MGGADPTGLTPRVLDVLGRTGVPLAVTAVVQPAAQAAVAEVAATHPGLALTVTPPTGSLPELYTTHDVVVSASGTSVWARNLSPPRSRVRMTTGAGLRAAATAE